MNLTVFPLTYRELFQHIAAETARMSYPGSMSRGTKPVVYKGTKRALEEYFVNRFPIGEIWSCAAAVVRVFDSWHKARTKEIARAISEYVPPYNKPMPIAAKFLNTYMHQLMKYEDARPLLAALHLPLDKRAFLKLRAIDSPALSAIGHHLKLSPYSIRYSAHVQIQSALLKLIDELNDRPGVEFKIASRIDLNILWI